MQMTVQQLRRQAGNYNRGDNMGNGLFDYIHENSTNQQHEQEKPIKEDIPTPEQARTASTGELRQAALRIIENYHINQEIVAGCKAQILKDIENKENPYRMLYAAVEAISRLTGDGDNFFLQVEKKIADVYGLKGVKHD